MNIDTNKLRLKTVSKAIKLSYFALFFGLTQVGFSEEEDVDFFERTYKSVIMGVKTKAEYGDPDSYYKAIAEQLGIFGKAYHEVFKKYGWTKGKDRAFSAKLTRGEGPSRWEIMVVQVAIDPETKKPDPSKLKMKMVFLYDDGHAEFPEFSK